MRCHPLRLVLCAAISVLVGAGCGRKPTEAPLVLPGVDPAVAARLAAPGSPAFDAYLASASTDRLIDLRQPLFETLYAVPGPGEAARARLLGILAGMDRTLAETRGLRTYAEETARLAALPDSAAAILIALRRESDEVFRAADRPTGEKIDRLLALRDTLQAAGDAYGALPIWSRLGMLEQRRSRMAAAIALHRQTYEQARALDRLPEICRGWGQLAMVAIGGGMSEAQRDTLHHWTEQARAAGLAAVTAHLMSMQGYDAFRSGRSAASRAAFEDAIQTCREFREPAAAVSAMIFLGRLYAVLECWQQVTILHARAADLLAEGATGREPTVYELLLQAQLENLKARRLAALGRADEAHGVFRRAFAAAQELPYAEAGYTGWQWFESMMEVDRVDLAAEAMAAIEPAASLGELMMVAPRLSHWQAWLAWRQGDLDGATNHLERFRAEWLAPGRAVGPMAHQYLALKARVTWPQDAPAAAAMLLEGWRGLQARLMTHEPGPEAYLDLNRNPHLRWAAQDLLADEPRLGYGLELLWRDAMLRRSTILEGLTDLEAGALAGAAAAQQRLAEADAVHCVLRLRADGVVRWTAGDAGVDRATLPLSTDQLRARVAAALDLLTDDPGDPDAAIPAALGAALGDLARLLLPPRFLAPATRPSRLYLSAEGFLAQFPFAALNVAAVGDPYEPLAATVDLAYVRHGPGAGPTPGVERILVVADPVLDLGTRRRFGLGEGLAGARRELAQLTGALPLVEVLTGADASRARVMAAWTEAGVLYFAGHAITDPLVPFYSWIPLSGDDPAAVHPGIDIQDILSHRFDRSAAVFLSGCATGAPFADGLTSAPSLGDAFLDAGAAAAVQTYWSVRDQNAPVEPDRMLVAWRHGDGDLVAAVAAEQRRALQGPRGVRHPFSWAAWAVNVRGW